MKGRCKRAFPENYFLSLREISRKLEKSDIVLFCQLVRNLAVAFALFLSLLLRNNAKVHARFREILCHLIPDGTV